MLTEFEQKQDILRDLIEEYRRQADEGQVGHFRTLWER